MLSWANAALAVTLCDGDCSCSPDGDLVSTIEEAISRVNGGWTEDVHVCKGTYSFSNQLFVYNTIHLSFEPDAFLTGGSMVIGGDLSTIDGMTFAPPRPSVEVRADDVTITNTKIVTSDGWPVQVFYSTDANNLLIDGVGFEGQSAAPPILYASGGDVTVNNVTSSSPQRGQMFAAYGATLSLQEIHLDGVLSARTAEFALISSFASHISLSESTFKGPAQRLVSAASDFGYTGYYTEYYTYWTPPYTGYTTSTLPSSLSLDAVEIEILGEGESDWDDVVIDASEVDSVSLHAVTLKGHGGISIGSVDSVEITDLRVHSEDTLPQLVLDVSGTPSVEISESWFCGASSATGAPVSLVGSCADGCAIKDSVFVDTFGASGGSVLASQGSLALERTTFLGNSSFGGGATVRGAPGLSLSLDRALFAESEEGFPVIAGDPEIDASLSSFDEIPTEGALPDGIRLGVDPLWFEGSDQDTVCGRSVFLDEDVDNRWLIENQVGALTPCWLDSDGDGYGGTVRYDTFGDCGDQYVPAPGDCQEDDDEVYPGEGCPIDRDGDRLESKIDCDDRDPAVGQCELRWSGGCDTAGQRLAPLSVVALVGLSLRASARRSRSS